MKIKFTFLFFLSCICLAGFSQDNVPAHANRLVEPGEYRAAILTMQEHLKLQPQDVSVQAMLAKTLFYAGNMDSAYVLYKEILTTESGDYDACVFLGNYYYVKANNLAKITVTDEKKAKRFRKEEENAEPSICIENYITAGEYLEKAYTLRQSEEIKKSLVEIFTVVGNKAKLNEYATNKKY